MNKLLNAQQNHWEKTFTKKPDMFGIEPSYPARKASELFKSEGMSALLELGGGQGRDTLFFAQEGFRVTVLDYSDKGIEDIRKRSQALGISQSITAICHDARNRLPFEDESFDGCFSHMLYCMAFTTNELESLSQEIRRILKPGGWNIFTARNTGDPGCRTGVHHEEDMWEIGGFIVHFFSQEKVMGLAKGYEMVNIEEFEEGDLPRKLFLVSLRKGLQD
ncbi:MAG: SAM-dependent methyltransferase [Syntrophus sp. (in: bacteria)]|nr:SAM-dependent methyltransferase [Syntrophus sp. (in: bacteria)]